MKGRWGAALAAATVAAALGAPAAQAQYQPNAESLGKHKAPGWFNDAKLGIFIHWGPYSVPAWAPAPDAVPVGGFPFTYNFQYSEWYWRHQQEQGTPQWKYHLDNYGSDFLYDDFIPQFKAEKFEPSEWIRLFKDAGAKYFVLTSKHHDGFGLWPSKTTNRHSGAFGPKRDLIGDLFDAARREGGIRPGLYYSVYEWFNPSYKGTAGSGMTLLSGTAGPPRNAYTGQEVPYVGYKPVQSYVDQHQLPQMQEIIKAYKPDVLWCDGAWDNPETFWKTNSVIALLFNSVGDATVNDRCGQGSHSDFTTPEYTSERDIKVDKWEATRGIGYSFGYNKDEDELQYLSSDQIVDAFVDIVSKNGNLLLDIGPRADGTVPEIMQQRLRDLGGWLRINGAAIYGSKYWTQAADGDVHFTVNDGDLYMTALKWPGKQLTVKAPVPIKPDTKITLLGSDAGPLKYRKSGDSLVVDMPSELAEEATRSTFAYTFRVSSKVPVAPGTPQTIRRGDQAGQGAAGGSGSDSPSACAASAPSSRVTAARRGLRVSASRGTKVDVAIFRQSAGRTILGNRLTKRLRGTGTVTWNGRGARDGWYIVRVKVRGVVRRLAYLRRNGRFRVQPDYERPRGCDTLRTFKLERPVFGGRSNRPLNAAFRLDQEARVEVLVLRGSRLVKRFPGTVRKAGVTHRVRIASERLPRGRYTVRIAVSRGTGANVVTARAVARRL